MSRSSNPFELYEDEGYLEATIEIKKAISEAKEQYKSGVDAKEAYKIVFNVLDKFVELGATDSEPRRHAAKKFTAGTDLKPDMFFYSF